MSGEIIEFRVHRDRARMYRQQPVPRPPARPEPAGGEPELTGDRKVPPIAHQMKRIAALLEELNQLTRPPHTLPADTARQARILAKQARDVLRRWAVTPDDDRDGDPQPQLDDESLERMYRRISPEYLGD